MPCGVVVVGRRWWWWWCSCAVTFCSCAVPSITWLVMRRCCWWQGSASVCNLFIVAGIYWYHYSFLLVGICCYSSVLLYSVDMPCDVVSDRAVMPLGIYWCFNCCLLPLTDDMMTCIITIVLLVAKVFLLLTRWAGISAICIVAVFGLPWWAVAAKKAWYCHSLPPWFWPVVVLPYCWWYGIIQLLWWYQWWYLLCELFCCVYWYCYLLCC